MGRGSKALAAFIDSIPDSKLKALPKTGGTIHKTVDFRLDMQGVSPSIPDPLLGVGGGGGKTHTKKTIRANRSFLMT